SGTAMSEHWPCAVWPDVPAVWGFLHVRFGPKSGLMQRSKQHRCSITSSATVVWGETHLRRILRTYARYYNDIRTHWALDKDAPAFRPIQRTGIISSHAILGGLHHHSVHTGGFVRSDRS